MQCAPKIHLQVCSAFNFGVLNSNSICTNVNTYYREKYEIK